MSVIITFGRNRIAYTAAKSLAQQGIRVTTCDSVYPAMSFFSKYSHSFFTYPSYTQNPSGFLRTLLNHVKILKPNVLMPSHEETLIISYFKDRFQKYTRVPIASYEKMSIARDKTKMTEIATRLGIPTPTTYQVREPQDLITISKDVNYPAVIKIPRGRGSWGLTYVFTKEELIKSYRDTLKTFGLESGRPFIQEYIPGVGYGVSMLFNKGKPRAFFTHKRLMEYPITGGASVERISVRKPKMEEYARQILSHLGWHGVAMVEFKLDRRTKKPVFLEVNPRFWGSLNQAVCAGVDFPNLLYKMAIQGDVKPVLNYRVGIRTIWLFGKVQTILDAIKRRRGIQALRHLKPLRSNTYYDDFSFRDLIPFLAEPIPYLLQLLRTGSLDIYESVDEALNSKNLTNETSIRELNSR